MRVKIPWIPSKSQEQRMMQTIHQYQLEADARNHLDYEALVLWAIHVHMGKGKVALKNFYATYDKIHQDLLDHYSMQTDDDNIWLVHHKLKEIGVDVKEWHEEMKKNAKD